jgi:hypothetical protein
MHATKTDPALRSPAQRDAISGSVHAHLSAKRTHGDTCRCVLCRTMDAVYAVPAEKTAAETPPAKQGEPSLDALREKYATVRELCGVVRDFTAFALLYADALAARGQVDMAVVIRAAVANTLVIVGEEKAGAA